LKTQIFGNCHYISLLAIPSHLLTIKLAAVKKIISSTIVLSLSGCSQLAEKEKMDKEKKVIVYATAIASIFV
jgi:hypothetical protein